jgi:DMSO/TMAO reductase YedYZ molybdopterin-dependent catalytic subunit
MWLPTRRVPWQNSFARFDAAMGVPRDLPAGQRVIAEFPRFGLTPYAERFPRNTSAIALRVAGDVAQEIEVSDALRDLPRVEQISDFHCVTTWSHLSLRWAGVRFGDFYERIVVPLALPKPNAAFVVLRGQDGYKTSLPLQDLLAADVLLADSLDGQPLSIEHGAPLRLIAPAHYGYKSPKHLCGIEFRCSDRGYRSPAFRFMDHPRARIAFEERGRWFAGWLLRYLYRPLIGSTIARFAVAMEKHRHRDE